MSNWHNVSKSEPCPICHKTDWCNLSNDGVVAICHRVESAHPARSGSGWIHRLTHPTTSPRLTPLTTSTRLTTYTLDLSRVHSTYDADPILIEGLATTLGVDDLPLKAMDVRFNRVDECWSFPMRDADGKIVGLRYRELCGSKKWSARGSHDGLFYVDAASTLGRQSPEWKELIIVEGASDTAALMSLFQQSNNSLFIVGRSSCQTGAAHLRQLIRRIRPRIITIVADNDEPGIRGANLLADQLTGKIAHHCPPPPLFSTSSPPSRMLIVPYPYKDIRAWYLSNTLTPKLFADLASAQRWW